MKKLVKDDRGFALILTILIVSLIVAVTLQFNTSMEFEMNSAANLNNGIKMSCAARSGFHYALAALYEDVLSTDHDSEYEAWADREFLNSDIDSAFEAVEFKVRMVDHSGRINVNRLVKKVKQGNDEVCAFDDTQKEILTRLLKSLFAGLEDDEIGDIVNSIKDWIDDDDEVTEHWGIGAENTYYQGSSKPYSCRNGPLETIGELALIKGVDVIYDEIKDFLTVYGEDSKININTAQKKVLMALSDDLTDGELNEIDEYRKKEENEDDLHNVGWYKDAIWTNEDRIDPDLITVSSTHFEIISTGSKGAMKKVISGIVKRENNGTLHVLSRKVE
jgi:general secretion pathway protein K